MSGKILAIEKHPLSPLCVKRAPRSYKTQRAHSDAFHRTQKIKLTTQDYNNRWDFYSAFKGILYIKYLHTTVSTAKPEFLIPGHLVYPSSLWLTATHALRSYKIQSAHSGAFSQNEKRNSNYIKLIKTDKLNKKGFNPWTFDSLLHSDNFLHF